MKIGFGILVASLALQLAAGPAFCANAQTSQKTSQSSSNDTNEHPAKERLSQLSTELLHQVDLARQAIGNKDTQAAKQHVNQALADQNRIASLAKSKNLPMIIPLYSEFDTSATLGPLESARKSGNKGQGNNSNQQKRNRFTPVTVEETAAEYTYVGIDLSKAKDRLEAAKTALNNNNLQAAGDSLNAIGNDLVMQTVATDMPLLTARENVGIAEDAVNNNRYTEAAAALKEAASDLKRFADGNPPQHADEAKNLSSTIQSFAEKLPQNHSGAAAKIDGWWHQIDGWFSQPSQS